MDLFAPPPLSAAEVRARLEREGVKDDAGRYRVTLGGSSLLRPLDEGREAGVSLAALERQAKAERLAREEGKRERKREKRPREEPEIVAAVPSRAAVPLPPPRLTWLAIGLVVKLLRREPAALYKAKGVVRSVDRDEAGWSAVCQLLEGGESVRCAASELQTVLPRLGGRVEVVEGAYAGEAGVLEELREEAYACRVRLESGRTVELPYESVCKVE